MNVFRSATMKTEALLSKSNKLYKFTEEASKYITVKPKKNINNKQNV